MPSRDCEHVTGSIKFFISQDEETRFGEYVKFFANQLTILSITKNKNFTNAFLLIAEFYTMYFDQIRPLHPVHSPHYLLTPGFLFLSKHLTK